VSLLARCNFSIAGKELHMNIEQNDFNGLVEIFTPYITRKGKRIYNKNGKYFHFFVSKEKYEEYRKKKSN
jgi:hypothetical protein